ncbi:DUF3068 domain-containing protein [Corynebacterium freiburgense]|uniref:DUF3068 domain-containing protein n=1 Tax=Corynebacterium freiburgense TaxID=556548 RepID=UPI00146F9C95|nr:DUF3068 domain-containing protein [Corynebacterium freiburgense]WJZ01624.1 hypothetical protein CFREI_01600 [Corynebacterium freiburgense]
MLPKSRIVSALLVGLGVALLIVGLGAPRWLAPDGRLPLDFPATTLTLRDAKATVPHPEEEGALETAVTKQIHVELMEPSDDTSVTVRVGTTTLRENKKPDVERLIGAEVWSYRMDRDSGEAIGDAAVAFSPAEPVTNVPLEGVWVKFPTSEEVKVFDATLRKAFPAQKTESVDVFGREADVFVQKVPATKVGSDPEFEFAEEDGSLTPMFLYHKAERKYMVDQATGVVLDVHESINDFYGTEEGEERQPVMVFNGAGTEDSVQALAMAVGNVSNGFGWRIALYVATALGGVLLLFGAVGVFGLWDTRGSKPKKMRRKLHS